MPTPIYHITPVDNLPGIMTGGGLRCVARLGAVGDGTYVSIAHAHIQERRSRTAVPCAAGGNLCDYVPFYFAPRSPMLYVIDRGNVEGYSGGQAPILHLVVEAERVVEQQLPFAFTDGHAVMEFSRFFTDLADLDKIDWTIMTDRMWRDTLKDGDRKRRRQAEFLVHGFVPWELVSEIGVFTQRMATRVQEIMTGAGHQPVVTVHRDWYY